MRSCPTQAALLLFQPIPAPAVSFFLKLGRYREPTPYTPNDTQRSTTNTAGVVNILLVRALPLLYYYY